MHLEQRRLMVRHVGVHRTNDATVVDDPREIRQRFADVDATFTALVERKVGRHEARALGLFVKVTRRLLPRVLGQLRLWIERVEMRGATFHEQKKSGFYP